MSKGLLSLVVLLWLGGCGKDTATPTPDVSNYEARLEAALEISNLSTRDEALSGLAIAAAEKGKGQTVLRAVQAISDLSTRDNVAARSAAKLADAGAEDAALQVAREISNLSTRDEALQTIAQ